MSIIVKGFYLPGFTDSQRMPDLEQSLVQRGYDTPDGGPAIAFAFHNFMLGEITLSAGAEGFQKLSEDPRNLIVAACIKASCMSSIWWMAELEGDVRWQIYAGSWNEQLGVMVLEAPKFHPLPLVWISPEVDRMKEILQLDQV